MTRSTRPAAATAALALGLGFLAACAHSGARDAGFAEDRRPAPDRHSTVTAEELARETNRPIEEILQGRIAGVHVTRTNGGITVRIRGGGSLQGEPLYVINGIPISPGPGGALFGLTPREIESIRVLKDPADTAMYGVRAGNGVIEIRTRRPE